MNDIQKKILAVYAMITAGSILMLIPYSAIPLAGLACAIVGMLAAYIYRFQDKDNTIISDEMTYIIRSTWWASLILLIGTALFASVIISNGDMSPIDNLMIQAENGVIPTEGDIQNMQSAFIQSNARLISIAALFCLMPYPIYLGYRMLKGVRRVTA